MSRDELHLPEDSPSQVQTLLMHWQGASDFVKNGWLSWDLNAVFGYSGTHQLPCCAEKRGRNMTIQYFKSRKAVVPTSSELQHDTVRVLHLGKL